MNIGIIGTGSIAAKMADTIKRMHADENITLLAVASRSLEKSESFIKEHGGKKAYGSYKELMKDSEVDLVYIATPHSFHCEHALMAIENGKNVLVEKPFAVNRTQAQIMIEAAEKKGVFISEAMWTEFMPSADFFRSLKENSLIGNIDRVSAEIGYDISNIERIKNPEFAGGALLDIGVYPIHFAVMVLGDDFTDITGYCDRLDTGVDSENRFSLIYEGRLTSLESSVLKDSSNRGMIFGTEGFIVVDDINNPKAVKRYGLRGELLDEIVFDDMITGFEYELRACKKAISEGKKECTAMPHSLTLKVISCTDRLRKKWDIVYPFEKEEDISDSVI